MRNNRSIKQRLRTINQKVIVALLKVISFFPFWLLYLLSDVFYFLVAHVVGYRQKVIDENLRYSFPEKNEKERAVLRKKYYRHFCDLTFESLKMYSMSRELMDKRLSYRNVEVLNAPLPLEKGLIVLSMHYNNWEWGSSVQNLLKARLLMVYNRMRDNEPFDNFLLKSREKWGGEAVAMSNVARISLDYKRKNQPALLWLAADQSAPQGAQFWMKFLNREAPFFAGPVKLAQKLNQPLFFHRTRKLSRGKYEIDFTLLFEEPAKVDTHEILRAYVNKMEEVIREEPEYYLWSHRRWKHIRPEGVELIV